MKTFLLREPGHDYPSGTLRSSSSRTPLHIRGKIEPLARRGVVSLSAGHGSGVLVLMAVLDRRRLGWRSDFAATAPLGGPDFRLLRLLHVFSLVEPDAFWASRSRMVAESSLLHYKSGRQNAARRQIQRRPENALLEFLLRRDCAAAERARA